MRIPKRPKFNFVTLEASLAEQIRRKSARNRTPRMLQTVQDLQPARRARQDPRLCASLCVRTS